MSQVTNLMDVSLPLAVWLLQDDYDYNDDPSYISVTTLMKPLRQIILGMREKPQGVKPDVSDFIATQLGSTMHAAIERAWTGTNFRKALRLLGYPDDIIDHIKVNPDPNTLGPQDIPVYMELRTVKSIGGWKIGGKFDLVMDGLLQDNKSTSTYAWTSGSRDEDYCLQGSIYRLLNQDKIKEDVIRINYIFTDWQKFKARQDPLYPQNRLQWKDYPLMTVQETQNWIERKLKLIDQYMHAPEHEIPECTDEELWKGETVHKYYADPNKTARATKNFTVLSEAEAFKAGKGKGIVITVEGKVKRCGYCSSFDICSQKDRYDHD